MDRLWRSNSSISSRTSCPPDIVNEEDHNVDDNEIPDFTNWTIPKVDTKNVYKISWAENTVHICTIKGEGTRRWKLKHSYIVII